VINSFPWLWPYGEGALFEPGLCLAKGGVASQLNTWREQVAPCSVPKFVASTEALGALDYERCVHAGQIPTRDLAHDWYNGLAWLQFSSAKWRINAIHIEDSSRQPVPTSNGRSRLRDAITLFDENGALLVTTEVTIRDALLAQDWATLFVHGRHYWEDRARLLVFGHGLLDSLHQPHPGLCAKAIPVLLPSLEGLDESLPALLDAVVGQIQDPANFSPIPVMGIPGWFEESSRPGYYENRSVYRAKPTPRRSSPHERLAFAFDASTLALGKCAGQSLPDLSGGGKSGLQ